MIQLGKRTKLTTQFERDLIALGDGVSCKKTFTPAELSACLVNAIPRLPVPIAKKIAAHIRAAEEKDEAPAQPADTPSSSR